MGAAREKTTDVEEVDETLEKLSGLETVLYVCVVGITLLRIGYEAGKAKVK